MTHFKFLILCFLFHSYFENSMFQRSISNRDRYPCPNLDFGRERKQSSNSHQTVPYLSSLSIRKRKDVRPLAAQKYVAFPRVRALRIVPVPRSIFGQAHACVELAMECWPLITFWPMESALAMLPTSTKIKRYDP